MGRIKEPLSNGVMTGPDPAVLPQGTLSYCRNGVYKPNTLALQRASGRIVWGTVTSSASDITGLRDIQFDNGDHYLMAQVSSDTTACISTATVEGNGTFGAVTAITATTSFEAVHFNNRFYVMNGAAALGKINSQAVIYLSSTAANSPLQLRQHGMTPVKAIASGQASGIAAVASNFAASASGFYEYWTTEVIQYTQDGASAEIESAFNGSPLTVYVPSTAVAPLLTPPSPINSGTTHIRIYRSVPKVYATDHAYPDGFAIATLSANTASTGFVDTVSATVGAYTFAGGVWVATGWSNGGNVTSDNTTYAFCTGSLFPGGFGIDNGLALTGFNFGGFSGPILGIEVVVRAYVRTGTLGSCQVWLGKKGTGHSPTFNDYLTLPVGARGIQITATAAGSPQSVTAGGSTDAWVPKDQIGFVDTDFTADFVVALTQCSQNMAVDSVKAKVYYGAGQSEAAVVPYPTVVYTFGDTTVEVGKNGPPPISNTGDVYMDSLVVNSINEPKLIRYSYPGNPDAFPDSYYLGFQTKDNDRVTLIRRVNNTLVVGLQNSIWRVNYLPSERDASFDRGVATEPISKQYGPVNPMCACTFSVDGGPERIAFVSQKGIHTTDGYHFSTQTTNQDWRAILDISGNTSTPIALINDFENQELLFYYRNDALTPETYMCLHLNYSLTHVGTLHTDIGPSRTFEEALKIAGPVHMRNYESGGGTYAGLRSAWTVPRLNGDTTVFLGYGAGTTNAGAGKVYYETGTTIPANDPVLRYRTRRMYLAGESNEFRVNEVYAYLGSYTTSGGALGFDLAAQTLKTNDDTGQVTQAAVTTQWNGRKLGKWQMRQQTEGLILSGAVTGNPNNDVSIEYLMLDGEGFGVEDSGK